MTASAETKELNSDRILSNRFEFSLNWACHWSCRWLVLDTDSKDLVTVHTDGNEQLSVMSYGPGAVITADSVFF